MRRLDDSELEEFLASTDWVADRNPHEVDAAVADLERVGFSRQKKARSFLAVCLGLRIDHPPALVIAGRRVSSWTHFDPSVVCTTRDAGVARRCAEVAGTDLFPIGVDSFHLTVYSGNDGRFYAGIDSSVYSYGKDRNAMFMMMKSGFRPTLLGEWMI